MITLDQDWIDETIKWACFDSGDVEWWVQMRMEELVKDVLHKINEDELIKKSKKTTGIDWEKI